MIAVEVFDDRRCWLGEGPTATGTNNNQLALVALLFVVAGSTLLVRRRVR